MSVRVCNGVVYDAAGNPRPEFPDKVIGRWTCFGTYVEDGATTTTGKLVVTGQVFEFGSGAGRARITTAGFELADVDVVVDRSITGGTGRYLKARGHSTRAARAQQPDPADHGHDPSCRVRAALTWRRTRHHPTRGSIAVGS